MMQPSHSSQAVLPGSFLLSLHHILHGYLISSAASVWNCLPAGVTLKGWQLTDWINFIYGGASGTLSVTRKASGLEAVGFQVCHSLEGSFVAHFRD